MGTAGAPLLPSLDAEVTLARDYLAQGRVVVGFGTGAQILAIAAGGGVESRPLAFRLARVRRVADDALAGHMPAAFPLACYGR